jgi:hypothetical protein
MSSFHQQHRKLFSFSYAPASLAPNTTEVIFSSDQIYKNIDRSVPIYLKIALRGGGQSKGHNSSKNGHRHPILARILYDDGFFQWFPFPGGAVTNVGETSLTNINQLILARAELTIPVMPGNWVIEVRNEYDTDALPANLANGNPLFLDMHVFSGMMPYSGWGRLMGEGQALTLGTYRRVVDFCWPDCSGSIGSISPGAFFRYFNTSGTTHAQIQSNFLYHKWFTDNPSDTNISFINSGSIGTGSFFSDDVEQTRFGGHAMVQTGGGSSSGNSYRVVAGYRF